MLFILAFSRLGLQMQEMFTNRLKKHIKYMK